jgi:hypothetical protein
METMTMRVTDGFVSSIRAPANPNASRGKRALGALRAVLVPSTKIDTHLT